MKTTYLSTIRAFTITCAFSQDVQSTKQEKMEQLKHWEGTWSGTGWASSPDGARNEFDQTESIVSKLNGTILLIEGTGRNKGTDDIAFNALAIFTLNPEKERYDIRSYLASGESTSAEGYIDGDVFIWSFDVPGGKVRYTLTANETSWDEFGEFSRDGNQWYKFMEMNLSKDSKNK